MRKPVEYFDGLHENFLHSCAKAGRWRDAGYQVGPYLVGVQYANARLEEAFSPALAHVKVDAKGMIPDLRLCVWDSVSTNTKIPYPDLETRLGSAPHEIIYFNDGRTQAAFQMGLDLFSLLDSERRTGLFWVRDVDKVPFYERCAPFKVLFNWWLSIHGIQAVHSAAVGNGSGGVLITGKGGSGKSTTALRAMMSGLSYLGDDFCFVAKDPEPFAFGVYNSVKLEGEDLSRFPELAPLMERVTYLDSGKGYCFLYPGYQDRVKNGFPLKAILVARVSGGRETRVTPLSPAAALRAVAPSTVLQLPGDGPVTFRFLADLVKKVPTYLLSLGTDIDEIPGTIARFLNSVGSSPVLPGEVT